MSKKTPRKPKGPRIEMPADVNLDLRVMIHRFTQRELEGWITSGLNWPRENWHLRERVEQWHRLKAFQTKLELIAIMTS